MSLILAACSNEENAKYSDKTAKETTVKTKEEASATEQSDGKVTFGGVSFKTPPTFTKHEVMDVNSDERILPFSIEGANLSASFTVDTRTIDITAEEFFESKKASADEYDYVDVRIYESNGIQWVEEVINNDDYEITYSTMTVRDNVLYNFKHSYHPEQTDGYLDEYADIIASITF